MSERQTAFVQLVLAAVVLVAGTVSTILALGDQTPVGAAFNQQYLAEPDALRPCYASLSDDQPTCMYVYPVPLEPARDGRPSLPSFGEEGLPLRQVPRTQGGAPSLIVHSPAVVALWGMEQGGAALINAANWLVATQREGAFWYEYDVFLSNETIRAPWKSAFAQGQALSALARAHGLDPRPEYLTAIHAAVRGMPTSPEGWPEEYSGYSRALNPGLAATLGLWDAWLVTHDELAREQFNRAVGWLVANLHRYDKDFVIQYSIEPHTLPASASDMELSVAQLKVLAVLTGANDLQAWAEMWEWRLSNRGAFRLNLYVWMFLYHPGALFAAGATLVGAFLLARRSIAILPCEMAKRLRATRIRSGGA